MMSGLMAKPLPKKETRSFASHASLNDQPAWVQELVLPPPKKGEVLLLARISDETAERASRNDHRCEKCGLGAQATPATSVISRGPIAASFGIRPGIRRPCV